MSIDRRDLLKVAGIGAAVFASGLGGPYRKAVAAASEGNDFFFVQLSDSHWGFTGPAINPDSAGTLVKGVAAVNDLKEQPDFVVFTGDLTHVTDDEKERRARLTRFKDIVKELKVKDVRFMPGEHDAGLDEGEAYKEFFKEMHYALKQPVPWDASRPYRGIGFRGVEKKAEAPQLAISEYSVKGERL